MILLGAGSAISFANSMGEGDREKMNLSFSSGTVASIVVGSVTAFLTFHLCSYIIPLLVRHDMIERQYAFDYLETFCYAVPFWIVAGVFENILRTDGATGLVRIAVAIGIAVNIGLDILLVGHTNLGISGAAWATAINYLLILIICLFHFASKNNNLKWSPHIGKYFLQMLKICKIGFSTSLNTILLAGCLFVINNIVIRQLGSEGIYCWAVCYQIFILLQMILNGIDTSIFAIGGVLVGEDDVTGLKYLYRRCLLYMIISSVALSLLIIIFPEFFGTIFGNKGDDRLHWLPTVLKIFSLFLLPYALVAQVRTIYTILGRRWLSLSLSILPFAFMIAFVFLLSVNNFYFIISAQTDFLIWWGFPCSSWLLLLLLVIFTLILHEHNKNLRFYSLIPKKEPGPSLNVSVSLDPEAVISIEKDIESFLDEGKTDAIEKSFVLTVCKNAMEGILNNLQQENVKNRYFDLHIRIIGDKINAIFKDDGSRISIKEEDVIFHDLNENENSGGNLSSQFAPYKSEAQFLYLNYQNILKVDFYK